MRRRKSEAGEGQVGCLFGLILFLAVVFIAYKMIPVKVRAAELRQTVTDEAKAAGTHDDKRITEIIVAKAAEEKLPVTEENVKIVRQASEIIVDVDYYVPIEFPGHTFKWHLKHHAQNPIF